MLVDTHCHLDDEKFDLDRENVIQNLQNNEISFVINAGADLETSKKALGLASENDNIYCVIGQHPQHCEGFNEHFEEFLINNAVNHKVVGIGEIGLDYYYLVSPKELQKEVFLKQLKLANFLKLPVVLHVRDAWGDALEILKQNKNLLEFGGVVHCFSGSVEIAQEILNLGLYLGFDGPITYKNAGKILDVVKITPLNRIFVETDSPYLTPQIFRGERNEPKFVKYVAEKVCEIKNITLEEFEKILLQNVKNLYKKIK